MESCNYSSVESRAPENGLSFDHRGDDGSGLVSPGELSVLREQNSS